ncbi:MAG: energy transducer TonB [Proteobacteria bacterium]|nr:energy transducer TonB [Pseudomonadota bacterium]
MTLVERISRQPPAHTVEPDCGPLMPRSLRANVVPLDFGMSAARTTGSAHCQTRALSPFSIPKPLAPDRSAQRNLLVAAIALSAAVHGGILASMFMRDSGEQFGTLSDKTDTFSLSMEQSVVLESISTESVQMAAAAAASAQAGSVQSAESKPQELAETESDPLSDEPPPKPVKVADVTPAALAPTDDPLPVIRGGGEADAVSEFKADQISETPVEEMPDAVETKEDTPAKPKREKEVEKEKKTPQKESHQQVAGSATSRSNAAQAAVNGRVSASRGNALSYGAKIRAQLAHNKPTSLGMRGTVRVSFGISADGSLRYLRLSESSGSTTLDDVALATVRKSAPFGDPPPELTPNQLSYVIPFYFR